MSTFTDPTQAIARDVRQLESDIDGLKGRIEAVGGSERIDAQDQLDILTQRQRALVRRLDTSAASAIGSDPPDIQRELAELKRAVVQVADRLGRPE